jgi:hypothetical protein
MALVKCQGTKSVLGPSLIYWTGQLFATGGQENIWFSAASSGSLAIFCDISKAEKIK